jgi:hypothetical protein
MQLGTVYFGNITELFQMYEKLCPCRERTFFQPVHRLALKQIHDITYTYIQTKPGTSRRR